MIPRIEMRRHPGFEGQTSWTEAHNRVEVHLKDGRVLTERADRATTGALRGVTRDDVRTKFRDCAAVALNPQDAETALAMLDGLEDAGPVGPLASCWGVKQDHRKQQPKLRPAPLGSRPVFQSEWASYCAVTPPSITSSEPVINDDSSDARNKAPLAMSSGVPMRFNTVRSITSSGCRRRARPGRPSGCLWGPDESSWRVYFQRRTALPWTS